MSAEQNREEFERWYALLAKGNESVTFETATQEATDE